jgi:hypothetical protein
MIATVENRSTGFHIFDDLVALLDVPVGQNKRAAGDQARSRNRFAYNLCERIILEGVAADAAQQVLLAIIGAQNDSHVITLGPRSNPCAYHHPGYLLFLGRHFTFERILRRVSNGCLERALQEYV